MTNFHKMAVAGAAACALMLGISAPAFASSAMCADKSMAADSMMKDDNMAPDNMAADGMAKDAMAGDKMATPMKEDSMAPDAMKTDSMAADNMAPDSMKADSMGGAMMAEYTVKPGDSLWSIAASELCDGAKYTMIVDANQDMLGGGKMLQPGQVLHIPGD